MRVLASVAVSSILLALAGTPAIAAETPSPAADRGATWATLPNWSGTWWVDRPGILDTATAVPATATGDRPGDRTRPPYNAEYERKYRAVIDRRMKGLPADPSKFCMPVGMPRLLSQPFGVEFHVTPEMVHMTWELDAQVRRIYTDGRTRPPLEELFPTWTGYSVGRWEGDTLVVETSNIKEARLIDGAPDQTIDKTGGVLSGQHSIVERIRKTADDKMEIDVTITDPAALTRPWTFKKTYTRADPTALAVDYIFCQVPITQGPTKFALPTTREQYYQWFFVDGPNAPHRVATEMQNR
jgi:hypothetical protein